MADSFGDRVAAATAATGPLCAGIDPSSALLQAWGQPDDAKGLRAFCVTCGEAFAGVVSVVKPQVAFFERHGAAGMAELERLIADATAAGLIVIADAKRGDIDSTAAAYADAWLGEASSLAADVVTVHPYLGLERRRPWSSSVAAGRGVIVVARQPPRDGTCNWPSPPGDPPWRKVLLAEIAELNGAPEVPSGLKPIGQAIATPIFGVPTKR